VVKTIGGVRGRRARGIAAFTSLNGGTRRESMKAAGSKGSSGGVGFWGFFTLMYLFTSDTVEPIDKLEFFWRMLAGPFNFLPI